MRNIPTYDQFINEEKTYLDIEDELRSELEKTGVQNNCYDNHINISSSRWRIGHDDGSINVTFWIVNLDDIEGKMKKAKDVMKKFAKKHGLVASAFKDGIKPNRPEIQNWSNKAGRAATYVYSVMISTSQKAYKNKL